MAFAYLLFLSDRYGFWPQTNPDDFMTQIRRPVTAMLAAPVDQRQLALQPFNAEGFVLAAMPAFDPANPVVSFPPFDRLRDHLIRDMPDLIDQMIVEGDVPRYPGIPAFMTPPDPAQPVVLWLRLADHSWLAITVRLRELLPPSPFFPWLPWMLALGTILVISLLAARGISGSLRRFAEAAERLGANIAAVPMTEAGPREMRSVTRSFNQMQARLKRFVDDRTQMLAAISHDLRTPLSRLRMRADAQTPGYERQKNLADLDLMDRMIAATLVFARDDVAAEKRVKVDLASLTQTVCDEINDAGAEASYHGPLYLEIDGAPLSLMRAITNVVENAVKYGGRADVRLTASVSTIDITVTDQGPGIPLAEQERVFEPFYRLDPARSPAREGAVLGEMGGTGLGLAIARHAFRAHGGDISLRNGDGAIGLVVHLSLPRVAA